MNTIIGPLAKEIGETTISGGAFGTPSTFIVTFTITGPATASAHYHGPGGEADAKLALTTSGCPNLAPRVWPIAYVTIDLSF